MVKIKATINREQSYGGLFLPSSDLNGWCFIVFSGDRKRVG